MKKIIIILILSMTLVGCTQTYIETDPTKNDSENITPSETSTIENHAEIATIDAPVPITPAKVVQTDWEIVKAFNPDIQLYAVGFYDESLVLGVGVSGFVTVSQDGGNTWTESSSQSSCRFGLDILDGETMIAVGNGGENRLSTDGGATWKTLADLPLKFSEENQFVFMIDEMTIWVGSLRVIGYSGDGGTTFEVKPLPTEDTKILGMYFMSATTGYILDSKGLLYKTTDGCETYTMLPVNVSEETAYGELTSAIHFFDEHNGYIVYNDSNYKISILATKDGGKTWLPETLPEIMLCKTEISPDGKLITLRSPGTGDIYLLSNPSR